jgi:hypothetical protein
MAMMFPNLIPRSLLAMVCVLGWRAFILAEKPPQTTLANKQSADGMTLKADPSLQVKITAEFKAPKAHEIVEHLRAETKMDLTLADNINEEKPALGSLVCHNVPAWMIMEELAKSKTIKGQWERSGNGYRLTSSLPKAVVATTTSPSKQPAPNAMARLLWTYFLSLAPLVVVLAVVLIRRRRQTQQAGAEGEQPADAKSPTAS